MSRLESATAELAELTRLLQAIEASNVPEWSPEWIAMQTLLRRQVDLLHEIQLLRGSAEFEVQLIGGGERDSQIEADVLGNFLREFQAAVAAVAQTFIHGERGSRGVLPRDVLGAATLRVDATAAGSYVLRMEGPRDRGSQFTLEGSEQLPPFDDALAQILDLVSASDRDDSDGIRSVIAEIGSHRALVHLRQLSRMLARTQTAAVFVHRSPFQDSVRESRLPALAAERLHEVLSRTDQVTDVVYLQGQLSGVLWRQGIFELEVQDDSGLRVIRGRVVSELRDTVDDVFDHVIRAELERTVTTEADQQVRETYRLIGIGGDLGLRSVGNVRLSTLASGSKPPTHRNPDE